MCGRGGGGGLCGQGVDRGGCILPSTPPDTATEVDDTHPTGKHICYICIQYVCFLLPGSATGFYRPQSEKNFFHRRVSFCPQGGVSRRAPGWGVCIPACTWVGG